MEKFLGLAVLVVFVSACIGLDNGNAVDNVPNNSVVKAPIDDDEFLSYMDSYKQRRVFQNGNAIPDRSSYGVSEHIFDLLPPVPEDFLYKVYLLKYGRFVDIASLGPEYYKQPEFDSEFTKYGLRYWEEWKNAGYSKTHWGTVGFRVYPFSQHVQAAPGNSFNVTVIFSSDWNVETYQGVKIIPRFITNAVTEDGKTIYADDGAPFINVNVSPNEFLLTPAFPQFTPDWTKKLTFTGKIDENTPPGTYILSMKVGKPTEENSDKWLLEYLNLYSEGSDMIITDKPLLQAFIYVN